MRGGRGGAMGGGHERIKDEREVLSEVGRWVWACSGV